MCLNPSRGLPLNFPASGVIFSRQPPIKYFTGDCEKISFLFLVVSGVGLVPLSGWVPLPGSSVGGELNGKENKIRRCSYINHVQIISREQADELFRRLPSRSKLIFAIGIETGLRISDILRLRVRDVEEPMRVYVSRLRRVVPCPVSEWLLCELAEASNYALSPEHYIFPSKRKFGRSLHRTTFHRDIKQAAAGLDFSCSAHSTRKFYFALTADSVCNST